MRPIRFSPETAAIFVMMLAALVRCGGSSSSPSHACTPGASVACAGPGACAGFQVCKSDGSAFDACRCGSGALSGFEAGFAGSTDATTSDRDADGGGEDDSTLVNGADSSIVLTPTESGSPNDAACTGLACMVPPGCTTSLSGIVYDPAGRNPLYGAYVYIPTDSKGKLSPIGPGTRLCNTCAQSIGSTVTATITDAKGHFSLIGVPATANVPIVAQIGKWRREITMAQVTACMDNAVPDGSVRLPRTRAEGDMPQMALLTGGCDDLGCFLRNVGIDSSEFTAPHGGGRLDVYQGAGLGGVGNGPGLSSATAGNCTSSSCPLWSSKSSLESYDLVLLACECAVPGNAPPAAVTAMHDWVEEGGRLLATHFHYTWFQNGPADFQGVATWLGSSTATGVGTYALDTSFPKGAALATWLGADAGIALSSVGASVSSVAPTTRRWIYDPNSSPAETKAFSFETPVGAGPYCGKAVFSDMHAGSSPSGDVPAACSSRPLTEEEKALEFLLFDLSACVSDDTMAPPLP